MDFLESINQGIKKANDADAATKEVADTFADVNNTLSQFDRAELRLVRSVSMSVSLQAIAAFSANNIEPKEYFNEDTLSVQVAPRDGRATQKVNVAKWKQSINGYPCTISFEGDDYICTGAGDLRSAFKMLFSSVSFGKAINEALS